MPKKVTTKDMQHLAASRGGRFLSPELTGTKYHYQWECEEGHRFSATAASVSQGSWCSVCSTRISERLCRTIFESIFGAAFPSKRPDWLLNVNGHRMELDGYCEKLGVAFEYQGRQHYEQVQFYLKTPGQFRRLQERDALKRKICTRRGVTLIEVPYWVGIDDVPEFVIKEGRKGNLPIIDDWQESQLDFSRAYSPRLLEQLQDLAASKGGKCLSRAYKGMNHTYRWQCSLGHPWRTKASTIKDGSWCPKCAGRDYTIEDMRTAAANHGGQCLSMRYVSAKEHLQWRCKEDHQFPSSWSTVHKGSWCPECAAERQRLGIEKVQEIARKRGGKCLARTYRNNLEILEWQCALGHVWPARAANIIRGDWCPDCAGNRKQTIEDMKTIAARHGGECLSSEYHNALANLLWRCAENHEFVKAPTAVQQGNWCSFCKGTRVHIQDMHDLAEVRGGKCLAKKYRGMEQKLPWECAEGHRWDAVPGNVVRGRWCPTCGGVPTITLEDMKELARSRGGECLSTNYKNMHTKLRWRCAEGHEWLAKPHNVKQGQWCRKCFNHERFLMFKANLEQVVKDKEGAIISEYSASKETVRFRCARGHEWENTANNVSRGAWCRACYYDSRRKAE